MEPNPQSTCGLRSLGHAAKEELAFAVEPVVDRNPEALDAATNPRFDGAERAVDAFSNLFLGKTLEVGKLNDLALFRRKFHDG